MHTFKAETGESLESGPQRKLQDDQGYTKKSCLKTK